MALWGMEQIEMADDIIIMIQRRKPRPFARTSEVFCADYKQRNHHTIRDVLYINAQQDRWYRTGQEAESQMFAPSGE